MAKTACEEGFINLCKGCPYHLRADENYAICAWDYNPENPTGCNDNIVRIYRISTGESNAKSDK